MNNTETNQLSITCEFGIDQTVTVKLGGSKLTDKAGYLIYFPRAARPWSYQPGTWVNTRERFFKTYEAMMAFVDSLPGRLEYNDKLMGYVININAPKEVTDAVDAALAN